MKNLRCYEFSRERRELSAVEISAVAGGIGEAKVLASRTQDIVSFEPGALEPFDPDYVPFD